MNVIVVVDNKWGIGRDNNLLFRLKKDMAFFKQTTTGKVVVMGANTFKSFPNGALPNRTNIVLDDSGAQYPDTISVSSVAELNEILSRYNPDEIFIIGGARFYAHMLNRCNVAYVTKVSSDGNAEVFFPNLDHLPNWQLVEQSESVTDGEYEIRFCKYVNNAVEH